MTESSDLQTRIKDRKNQISRLGVRKSTLEQEALLLETIGAVKSIVAIAGNFSYLWDKGGPLHGEVLDFISYWSAPDELEWMRVKMEDGKLYFFTKDRLCLSEEETAREMIDMNYRNPRELITAFKHSLKKPLGDYMSSMILDNYPDSIS